MENKPITSKGVVVDEAELTQAILNGINKELKQGNPIVDEATGKVKALADGYNELNKALEQTVEQIEEVEQAENKLTKKKTSSRRIGISQADLDKKYPLNVRTTSGTDVTLNKVYQEAIKAATNQMNRLETVAKSIEKAATNEASVTDRSRILTNVGATPEWGGRSKIGKTLTTYGETHSEEDTAKLKQTFELRQRYAQAYLQLEQEIAAAQKVWNDTKAAPAAEYLLKLKYDQVEATKKLAELSKEIENTTGQKVGFDSSNGFGSVPLTDAQAEKAMKAAQKLSTDMAKQVRNRGKNILNETVGTYQFAADNYDRLLDEDKNYLETRLANIVAIQNAKDTQVKKENAAVNQQISNQKKIAKLSRLNNVNLQKYLSPSTEIPKELQEMFQQIEKAESKQQEWKPTKAQKTDFVGYYSNMLANGGTAKKGAIHDYYNLFSSSGGNDSLKILSEGIQAIKNTARQAISPVTQLEGVIGELIFGRKHAELTDEPIMSTNTIVQDIDESVDTTAQEANTQEKKTTEEVADAVTKEAEAKQKAEQATQEDIEASRQNVEALNAEAEALKKVTEATEQATEQQEKKTKKKKAEQTPADGTITQDGASDNNASPTPTPTPVKLLKQGTQLDSLLTKATNNTTGLISDAALKQVDAIYQNLQAKIAQYTQNPQEYTAETQLNLKTDIDDFKNKIQELQQAEKTVGFTTLHKDLNEFMKTLNSSTTDVDQLKQRTTDLFTALRQSPDATALQDVRTQLEGIKTEYTQIDTIAKNGANFTPLSNNVTDLESAKKEIEQYAQDYVAAIEQQKQTKHKDNKSSIVANSGKWVNNAYTFKQLDEDAETHVKTLTTVKMTYDKTANGIKTSIEKVEPFIKSMQNSAQQAFNALNQKVMVTDFDSVATKLGSAYVDRVNQFQQEVANVGTDITDAKTETDIQTARKKIEELNAEYTKLKRLGKMDFILPSELTELEQAQQYIENIAKGQQGYVPNSGQWKSGTNYSYRTREGNQITTRQMRYSQELGAVQQQVGKTTQYVNSLDKFIGSLRNKWQEVLRYFLSFASIYRVISVIRQGITIIREFDTAMTEMAKVSNDTEEELQSFGRTAYDVASEVYTTGAAILESATSWEKLGYAIREASELAKNSAIYSNVGDMDIATATEHMVSTLKAFNVEAEDSISIIDKFNEIGNNYAITSEGIGEALQRSAATLVEAGNTIDESIALITAANVIQQSPETVGNALKVVSMRLRGAKSDLEDAGEETEGMVTSTAKLREELLALSGVDIMLDDNTYKSTYQILSEIADVWDTIGESSQTNQARILEMVAGKTRGSIVAGLLQQGETLKSVLEDSENSSGSAYAELNEYSKSIAAHMAELSNAWQKLWTTEIDRSVINFFVDLGTSLVKVMDNVGGLNSAISLLAMGMGGIGNMGMFSVSEDGKSLIRGSGRKYKWTDADRAGIDAWIAESKAAGVLKSPATSDALKDVNGQVVGFAKNLDTIPESAKDVEKSMKKAAGGIDKMTIASRAANMAMNFLISIVINLAITAITKVIQAAQEAKEAAEQAIATYTEAQTTLRSHQRTIKELSEDYEKLAQGVDRLGRNNALTTEQYEQYQSIMEDIESMYPQLINYHKVEGETLLTLKGNIEEVTQAYKDETKAARDALVAKKKDILENYQNTVVESNWLTKNLSGIMIKSSEDVPALMQKEILERWLEEGSYLEAGESYIGAEAQSMYVLLRDLGLSDPSDTVQTINEKIKNNRKVIIDALNRVYDVIETEDNNLISLVQADLLGALELNNIDTTDELENGLMAFLSGLSTEQLKEITDSVPALNAFTTSIINMLSNPDTLNTVTEAFNDLYNIKLEDDTIVGEYVDTTFSLINAICDVLNADDSVRNAMLGLFSTSGIQQEIDTIANRILGTQLSDTDSVGVTAGERTYSSGSRSFAPHSFGTRLFDVLDPDTLTRFLNTLSKEDLDIAATLEFTGVHTTEEVKQAIEEEKERLARETPFSLSDNKDEIDDFQSTMQTIADTYAKIQENGSLEPDEFIDLAQTFSSNPELLDGATNLSDALKTLAEDALATLLDTLGVNVPDTLRRELEALCEAAFDTVAGFESLQDAISTLTSHAEVLRNVKDSIDELEEGGTLTSNTIGEIAGAYPELEEALAKYHVGLLSTQDIWDELTKAYDADKENYKKYLADKLKTDEEYYAEVKTRLSEQMSDFQKQYRIDLTSYATYGEAKLALDAATSIEAATHQAIIANKWNNYGNNYDPSKVVSVEQVQEDFAAMLDSLLLAFNESLDFETYGKDVDTFEESIDWAASSIEKLTAKVDALDSALSNANSTSERLGILENKSQWLTRLRNGLAQQIKVYQTEWEKASKAITSNSGQYASMIQSNAVFKIEDFTGQEELYESITEAQEAWEQLTSAQEAYQDNLYEIRANSKAIADEIMSRFDTYIQKIESVNAEIESIFNLVDGMELFKEDGSFTDEAITQLGLYTQQLNSATEAVDVYRKKIQELVNQYEAGNYNLEDYNELLATAQQEYYDSIAQVKEYKDAIIDFNKQAIEKQIELHEELIEKKKEELDAEKELYEYQKSINEQSASIDVLQRQIAALSTSTDRRDIAQRLQLEKELADAQEALTETQEDYTYDKKVQALDDELEQFTEEKQKELDALSSSLSAQNQAIVSYLDNVQNEYSTIYLTLAQYANDYNLDLSHQLMSPWESAIQAAELYQSVVSNVNGLTEAQKQYTASTVSSVLKVSDTPTTGLVAGTALNRYLLQNGYTKLSWADMAQLGQDLGLGALTEDAVKGNGTLRLEILDALKKALGFKNGGVVSSIAQSKGESGLAWVRKNEALITPQQTEQIMSLVASLNPLQNLVQKIQKTWDTNMNAWKGNGSSPSLAFNAPLVNISGVTRDEINRETQQQIAAIPKKLMQELHKHGV